MPYAGLIRDTAGNLYGTTFGGGASGYGMVFKLDTSTTRTETVLYSFTGGADGSSPHAGLIRDAAGNLYGTTAFGGASGQGVVFKLDTAGNETVLHSFTGGADGYYPTAGLIPDASGNLYGTTFFGGASNCGVVFKVDTAGNETVVHSFAGGADGANPWAGLIRDAAGNLYGTTNFGGAFSFGTVFKLDTAGNETVLYSFTGADGFHPTAGLIRDAAGNLYGTTEYGGAYGGGTVFKLDTAGKETVLYALTYSDGSNPIAGLIRDPAGNLYGTTFYGGLYGSYGVVFKLDTAGNETVLHNFTGGVDGAQPYAGLIRDAAGNLYGTTRLGGTSGYGVVFKLAP